MREARCPNCGYLIKFKKEGFLNWLFELLENSGHFERCEHSKWEDFGITYKRCVKCRKIVNCL